ncbi:Trp biosynthesis-associated membrane protein [Ornithinimicrobium sp. INDO-MA30-4]|uniref:Trp biosynthesis-associated membrane protein n=1 Tax=Ornithinimicrobium sp. INDO-MA30-4 TaxID=2908651 RepID=UPI001F302853|nr:Trp biosynthesis-associated membrane protein [Ornithinimicrobium sp. INDO-MA30-4]UJH71018.1 Trp biosynthesis-associated membrane protein [Ornithinimicrobium sp. INDO-MA30-4]
MVILDPASALRSGIAGTLSINGPIESASLGWAVWAALVTGLLVTSAVVVRAIATPALRAESASKTAREHTATDLAEAERRRQVSAWDDLSRGDDPTQSGSWASAVRLQPCWQRHRLSGKSRTSTPATEPAIAKAGLRGWGKGSAYTTSAFACFFERTN